MLADSNKEVPIAQEGEQVNISEELHDSEEAGDQSESFRNGRLCIFQPESDTQKVHLCDLRS